MGWHERASLVHDEMQKHYPQFAKAFDPYASDDYDCDHYDDWAAEESIKVTAAAAYAVNHTATTGPRASNPSPTPRRQTGGSDSEDPASASDDHDSHILAYHKYNQQITRLICWTSALEVVTAAIPAAKTIQKDTRYIGKLRLVLADYPADFTPDYSFLTLIRAAFEVGYTAAPNALTSVLQSTVGAPGHPLFPCYSRFETLDEADEDIAQVDLSALAKLRDPDGGWYKIAARVAQYACRAWAKDPIHGNDIVHDVTVSTYISLLRKYDPEIGVAVATYARVWARSHLRDTLPHLKTCISRNGVKKRLAKAEQLLERHRVEAPADDADEGVVAVWEHHRRGLAAEVEKHKTTTGGIVVLGLDASIPLADDSISVVDDNMPGDEEDSVVAVLQQAEATAAVRKCLSNQVINDLIEKIQTVSAKIREEGELDMEYLARIASNNKPLVALIKKAIGPDGLARLAECL